MEVISKKRKVAESTPESTPAMQKELIRLVIQTLYDSGFRTVAEQLEVESGIQLETSEVKEFREGVISGNWDLVSSILPAFGIPSKAELSLKLCIKEQKYLEQISEGSYSQALSTLRAELTPLHNDSKSLHHLASLLLCKSPEELKQNSEIEYDRKRLMQRIQTLIPANIMIPEARLSMLVSQALELQIRNCKKHCGFIQIETLLEDHSCDSFSLPSQPVKVLQESAEIWDADFSHNGNLLAAVCQSSSLGIWELSSGVRVSNIICDVSGVGWTLDDQSVATGSTTGIVNVWSLSGELRYSLKDHTEKVTSCVWISNSQMLTGGVDRKLILWENRNKARQWEIRVRQIEKATSGSVIAVLSASKNEVSIISYDPLENQASILEEEAIISIQISSNGKELLTVLGLGQPKIHLWSIKGGILQTFEGFTQEKFVLKPAFAGPHEDLVVIGAEDGKVHVWSKMHGVKLGELNQHVNSVNVVCLNPKKPHLLVTAGDDATIRLWDFMVV